MDDWSDDVIRGELGPSEKLLWSGRPRQGLLLRWTDALAIPFSLMWSGFAIFWEVMVVATGAPIFFVFWGIPFVLVGLYLIAGRFWIDARQRASTHYGVTSERVVIVSGMRSRTVKSLSLDNLSDVSLTERADGSGTITFGPLPFFHGRHFEAGFPGFGLPAAPTFDLPDEAREVYEIIRKAQQATRQHA